MKLKLILALAVLTAAAPAFAQSGTHINGAHMRTQTFHDRSPHIHNHGSQPHHQA